jgi:CRP-like cAMP-binding protein
MALLTGESRAANVIALGEVVVIEITKDALQPVLHDHPDLAAAISKEVAERRGSLESLRMASNEEAEQTVLSRIRAYFGL